MSENTTDGAREKADNLADELRAVDGTEDVNAVGGPDSAEVSCSVVEAQADAVRDLADEHGFTPTASYPNDGVEWFMTFDYDATPAQDTADDALSTDEFADFLESLDGNFRVDEKADRRVTVAFGSVNFSALPMKVAKAGWNVCDVRFEDRELVFRPRDEQLAKASNAWFESWAMENRDDDEV